MEFDLAVNDTPEKWKGKVVCKKNATMPIELQLRQAPGLKIRNASFPIKEQQCDKAILIKTVLERAGINPAEILAEAADNLQDGIDATGLGIPN